MTSGRSYRCVRQQINKSSFFRLPSRCTFHFESLQDIASLQCADRLRVLLSGAARRGAEKLDRRTKSIEKRIPERRRNRNVKSTKKLAVFSHLAILSFSLSLSHLLARFSTIKRI